MDTRAKTLMSNALVNWCNSKLINHSIQCPGNIVANNMEPLIELINTLAGGSYKPQKWKSEAKSVCHFLKKENVPISRGYKQLKRDLHVEGDHLLYLLSDLMLHYCVTKPLTRDQQYNIEEPRELLLTWINRILGEEVYVSNFTDDWKDGRILGALLHSIDPRMCPEYNEWDPENYSGNIQMAMESAFQFLLCVNKLIEPTDMCSPNVPDIVIITYLSQLLSASVRGSRTRKVLTDSNQSSKPNQKDNSYKDLDEDEQLSDIDYEQVSDNEFHEPEDMSVTRVKEQISTPTVKELSSSLKNADVQLNCFPPDIGEMLQRICRNDVLFVSKSILFEENKTRYHKQKCKVGDVLDIFFTKTISDMSEYEMKADILEAHTRSILNQDNVLKLVALTCTGNEVCTIMPWMTNGILQEYLHKHSKELDINEHLTIAKDIAQGMEYLSGNDYVLQKLTSKTCMVSIDKRVKIYDLSCLSDIIDTDSVELKQDIESCYKFLAPEVFKTKRCTKASDVYMFAVLMWNIFSGGKEPYEGFDVYSVIAHISKDKIPHTYYMTPEIYEVVQRCSASNARHRPTFKEVLDMIVSLLLGDANHHYEDTDTEYFPPTPM